jgi:hypothetical protein
MAKGQKRSSREIRKPKKDKVPAKADTSFGLQIKQADARTNTTGKPKK